MYCQISQSIGMAALDFQTRSYRPLIKSLLWKMSDLQFQSSCSVPMTSVCANCFSVIAPPKSTRFFLGLEQSGLAATVAASISLLPHDLRGMFWANIGLIGGSTNFPGFYERL
jgi:hypothetical protein